jgi:uncharacterized protein with HEPN domain
MRAEDRVRVLHMIDAAESVGQFMANRPRADLDCDRMLLFAVIRAIEIIGEAAGKVSEEARLAYSDIPWNAIVGMRNRLIHGYFDIDTEIVWKTVSQEVPFLLPRLHAVISLGKEND